MTTEAPPRRELVALRKEPKVTGMPTSGLMTLVGDTKSGKTTLAASFPDSYVIELEKRRGDRIRNARIDEVNNLKDFGDVLELALEAEDIRTLVIDSVDQIGKWIADDIATEAGVEFIGKPKHGVDSRALWGEYAVRIQGLVNYLKDSNKLVIFIAHRRPADTDSEGRITKPAGINISGKGGDYIAQQSEIIGFMDVRVIGGQSVHFLSFKGESQRAIWRSGVDELHDKEIIIKKSDPYGSFAEAFNKPAAKAPPTLKPAPAKTAGRKR